VSGPSCSTCQVFIGTRVALWLVQVSLLYWTVSYFYWSTWRDHSISCVLLLDHVSRCCTSVYQYPCVFFYSTTWQDEFVHVFGLYWPTCPVLTLTCVIHWFIHMSDFYLTTWHVLDLPYAHQSLHKKNDFRSTLLYKMTTCIIILKLSQITAVQLSSKPLIEFI
jgi:hypothetical protein